MPLPSITKCGDGDAFVELLLAFPGQLSRTQKVNNNSIRNSMTETGELSEMLYELHSLGSWALTNCKLLT